MISLGEVFDNKYRIDGFCSVDGGMGDFLFVTPLTGTAPFRLVLKYCKQASEESLKRFRREARIMATFRGNSKVVQIWDQNLDHNPPYIVMKYYEDGDISKEMVNIQNFAEIQEKYFLQMIDCVQELHSRNEFHRDIKPMNFLREGPSIVVSDFGLSTEMDSITAFTSTTASWGTQGYIPPEFMDGGFKNADATSDIYMLGKTFYALLTGRWPAFTTADGISPPVFHVIERCVQLSKSARYQSLADLKQSLVTAYDVLLGRAGGKAQQLFSMIKDRLEQANQYDRAEVSDFVEQLALISEPDQIQMCFELPKAFFGFIGDTPALSTFLSIYERMVERSEYGWG
jgi:serine/threonine protein kinase